MTHLFMQFKGKMGEANLISNTTIIIFLLYYYVYFATWTKISDLKILLDSNPTISEQFILSEMLKDIENINETPAFDNDDRVTISFLENCLKIHFIREA